MHIDLKTGWVPDIRTLASPNYNSRPAGTTVDLLVIHCISLPPGRYGEGYIEKLFTNQLPVEAHPYFRTIANNPVSAHFLIDREGVVTQFVSVYERAWHAGVSSFEGQGSCNDYSVGVELEGCVTDSFTFEQYKALEALSIALKGCFPAINCGRIVGHSDIAPGRKDDPGPFFDWQEFFSLLKDVGF
ncbi:MAG: N-acetyl-anhydromuranmyl-L-alanine amidase AmpD [Gammaproteobacteria bacterium]|jgi:AmpD protein|nr:N-acetyl-anhydromuranmyl-L-alanine amidase AmpD [Gammaproteobacteria bacterium]